MPPIWVFQGLKIDDRQTRWDYIHDENIRRGENKYSTLQKVSDLKFQLIFIVISFQLIFPECVLPTFNSLPVMPRSVFFYRFKLQRLQQEFSFLKSYEK